MHVLHRLLMAMTVQVVMNKGTLQKVISSCVCSLFISYLTLSSKIIITIALFLNLPITFFDAGQ